MLRRFTTLSTALWLLCGLPTGAHASAGVDEHTLLIDGGVAFSAAGSTAGTYFARGLAELLVSRHIGLRLEGYTQFTEPYAEPLKLRLTGAMFGITVHPNPGSRVDPYVSASMGGIFATGEQPITVSPEIMSSGGLNLHFGRFFLHAQASWHFGNILLAARAPSVNDLRVTAGLGFSFDFSRAP